MENTTILQGRFVRKPELEQKGGFSFTEFTIAWSEKRKDNESKCFLRCKAWRGLAEMICQYFDKGQECVVKGKLVTEEWEKDGQKQSRTICNLESISFCGSKGNNAASTTNDDGFMNIADMDKEELPFS